jgi:hypothetical protein
MNSRERNKISKAISILLNALVSADFEANERAKRRKAKSPERKSKMPRKLSRSPRRVRH